MSINNFVSKVIVESFIEPHSFDEKLEKLCIRLCNQDLYTLGVYDPEKHYIDPDDFVLLSELQGCALFNEIVYGVKP